MGKFESSKLTAVSRSGGPVSSGGSPKVALVRMRRGHAAEVQVNRYLVPSTCLDHPGRMRPAADRLARCQRAANSSGYSNLFIKEGIESISAVRKLVARAVVVLVVETCRLTKNPGSRLPLLDLTRAWQTSN